jgi:hypothetical protein
MSDKACADSSRTVAGPGSDDSTFRDRLAKARSPEEAANILGKRRLIGYAFGFAAVAIGCLAASVYMIIEVATGQESALTLAALPALVSLVLFSGWSHRLRTCILRRHRPTVAKGRGDRAHRRQAELEHLPPLTRSGVEKPHELAVSRGFV